LEVTNVKSEPEYDLWTQPWIGVEREDGQVKRIGIGPALGRAHELRGLYDPSPLVVVGVHRLLAAVLQHILAPQKRSELHAIWDRGSFSPEAIGLFAERCGDRFGLFSEGRPFLQSRDLPRSAAAGATAKTVAYLFPEIPARTNVTHFRHGTDAEVQLCPACAAAGLVCVPAFATSGGSGIKPSINGVPPIYVLPQGASLFHSLAASVLLPDYLPAIRSPKDEPWWERDRPVPRSGEVVEVGYIQSLLFPARRVRLHPEVLIGTCSRCADRSEVVVRTMVYEMGESRPKGAPCWHDPFSAYTVRDVGPVALRPQAGKALWREFGALFVSGDAQAAGRVGQQQAPRVLQQMAAEGLGIDAPVWSFRCIGLRTDGKAKVHEWVDAALDVPPVVLRNAELAETLRGAVDFAEACGGVMRSCLSAAFEPSRARDQRARVTAELPGPRRRSSRGARRARPAARRMVEEYWRGLAVPFRELVLAASTSPASDMAKRWAGQATQVAREAFEQALEDTPDNAGGLRARVQAQELLARWLGIRRKEYQDGQG
jgi:CRISPR system Cascade subunit CasA